MEPTSAPRETGAIVGDSLSLVANSLAVAVESAASSRRRERGVMDDWELGDRDQTHSPRRQLPSEAEERLISRRKHRTRDQSSFRSPVVIRSRKGSLIPGIQTASANSYLTLFGREEAGTDGMDQAAPDGRNLIGNSSMLPPRCSLGTKLANFPNFSPGRTAG